MNMVHFEGSVAKIHLIVSAQVAGSFAATVASVLLQGSFNINPGVSSTSDEYHIIKQVTIT